MKKILLSLFSLVLIVPALFLAGCQVQGKATTGETASQVRPGDRGVLPQGLSLPADAGLPADSGAKRFEVICEEGQTNNIGGFTVIRDRQTGREYLVVTGLNGAPTVININ